MFKPPSQKVNEKGFSLIEIILVTALACAIILVLANIPSSIGLIGTSGHESIAKQIASQIIEDTRNNTYSNLSTNMPNGVTVTDSRLSKLPSGEAKLFIDNCPVSICTNNEEAYQVKATVTWKDKAEIKDVSVVTLVSNGGLN